MAPSERTSAGLTRGLALITLLVVSSAALFPLVFRGFATSDSARYALGLQSIQAGGLQTIPHVFNGEMSLGYYLLLGGLTRIGGTTGDPSSLMNSLNAACAVVLLALLFLLFTRLLEDPGGALYACLAVLLSPGFWLISHYGHPALPALTAFAGSLLVLDTILDGPGRRIRFLWVLFVLLATVAWSLRSDILLLFGAYPGLFHRRHRVTRAGLVRLAVAFGAVLLLVGGLRALVLGYLVNPEGGTVAYHLSERLVTASLPRTILKNAVLWVVSVNALIVLLALAGLARQEVRSRFGLLPVLWIAPWCVFLPFRGMDVARVAVPTIPILALLAVAWVASVVRCAKPAAYLVMLVLAQLVAIALRPAIIRTYDVQREIDGYVLAGVPLGFPPIDHFYRQRAVTRQEQIAREIAKERGSDVLIVGPGGLVEYRFHLESSGEVTASGKETRNGVVVYTIATARNCFFILNLNDVSSAQPIGSVLASLADRPVKLHLMPFWREHPTTGEQLFVDPDDVASLLANESRSAR